MTRKGEMDFIDTCRLYGDLDWKTFFDLPGPEAVTRALGSRAPSAKQFARLLSRAASGKLEEMARRASADTLSNFGRTMQLYTPLYVSNYCDNGCVYCGFNSCNDMERKSLSIDDVLKEGEAISATGIEHILLLTGESRAKSPVSYIEDCVRVLKPLFSSISIEVYALAEDEYARLVDEGVDTLTIYQEVYDQKLYAGLHPSGPKSDFLFRRDAPERAARAGIRAINIGTLFGLDEWRKEVFLTGLHASYLQDKFPHVSIGVAVPRMRPHTGAGAAAFRVSDADVTQAVMALRIFLPGAAITLSTREDAAFRENLVGLGITRLSAGSRTTVGGYAAAVGGAAAPEQFEISDRRTVAEIIDMLRRKGYQPVLKDWIRI